MKCPACNNDIHSFLYHYLWSHPFTTKCKACAKKLKPDSIIKKTVYLEMALCLVIFLIIKSIVDLYLIGESIICLISIFFLLYPFEKYSWDNGSYTIKD